MKIERTELQVNLINHDGFVVAKISQNPTERWGAVTHYLDFSNDEVGETDPLERWFEHEASKLVEKGRGNFSCGFCGKRQFEVEKLIAGPTAYICDECVELCHEIVEEEKTRGDAQP